MERTKTPNEALDMIYEDFDKRLSSAENEERAYAYKCWLVELNTIRETLRKPSWEALKSVLDEEERYLSERYRSCCETDDYLGASNGLACIGGLKEIRKALSL